MSINIRNNIRGDTLVEVLFATAVFSLVAVGCLSIMNQGAATAQRALEITLVRNEIDAQAETLRFLNASYIQAFKSDSSTDDYSGPARQWVDMQDFITSNNTDGNVTDLNCTIPENSFILNAHKASYLDPTNLKPSAATTFSRVVYDNDALSDAPPNVVTSAEGIWIETSQHWSDDDDGVGYIDFHIRACWDSPGQDVPVTLGTIVRLYEPHT